MNEQPLLKEENLLIIKEIETEPSATQRHISSKLGISLGKTNYLLKELIKKGLVKVRNFSDNPGKLGKIQYYLSKEGLDHKIELMQYFLKAKEAEYNQLKNEWEQIVLNGNSANNSKKEVK